MPPLTPAQQQHFTEEGYCVLERVLLPEHLAALDAACQQLWDEQVATMDLLQAQTLGLSHKDKRYFLSSLHVHGSAMHEFLFSDLIADIVRSLLGPDAWLFIELFVIKAREAGMPFGWHQDSGYLMGMEHAPYLTLWCALDDATAENGALQVLPYPRSPSRDQVLPHVKDRQSGDFVGYRGDDPGITVPVPRGSIIAMSSTLFHRSGPNTTPAPRRAFLAAFSVAPVLNKQGQPWDQVVPYMQSGERVESLPEALA